MYRLESSNYTISFCCKFIVLDPVKFIFSNFNHLAITILLTPATMKTDCGEFCPEFIFLNKIKDDNMSTLYLYSDKKIISQKID